VTRLVLQGIGLFAFIPIVLWLYLGRPLGPGLSAVLGLAVMFGHRFAASPWMARHALARCLWCAREAPLPERLEIRAGGRTWILAACGAEHGARSGRFLTLVWRARAAVGAGIFVPLVLLLAGSFAEAAGRPFIPHAANATIFRMVVALTVAGASVAYLAVREAERPLRCPFPLHNLFLLGIGRTLWVFRIVGAWWLASGASAAARRIAEGA
jgi:hypothetical protein